MEVFLVKNRAKHNAVLRFKHYRGEIIADKVGQYVVSALYINIYALYAMKLHRSMVIGIDKK
ncbi:MAG: RNase E specificity factor CsrD [Cognaticolwellia sp.]